MEEKAFTDEKPLNQHLQISSEKIKLIIELKQMDKLTNLKENCKILIKKVGKP